MTAHRTDAVERPDFAVALATLAATLLAQLPFVRHQALLLDEGVILQMAVDIGNGEVPYRDAVHYAFPGVFYLTAAVFEIFGPSVEAARLLAACLFSVAAAALALMARWWCTRREVAWFVVVLLCYRVWAFPHWHMLNYSPMAVTMSLVAAWLAGEQLARSGIRWAWAAGLFAGLAILAKQDSGGAATAALGTALLCFGMGDARKRFRTALAYSIAAGAVVAACLAAVWWAGYLTDLVREGIYGPLYGVANYDYLRRPQLFPLFAPDQHLRLNRFSYFPQILMEAYGPRLLESRVYTQTGLIDAALKLIYHAPWMVALAAALPVARGLWRQRTLDTERRALVLLLAGASLLAFNPPQDWVHLLVLYSPTLLLLASAIPATRRHRWLRAAIAASTLLAAAVSLHLAIEFRDRHDQPVHTPRGTFYTRDVLADGFREVLEEIADTPPGTPLVALPYHPFLNFLADRPPVGRYLFLWPVEWNADRDREIIAAIEAAPQPTIVYSPSQLLHLGSPRDFAPELFDYLVDRYRIAKRIGPEDPGLGFLLLERKNPPPGRSLEPQIAKLAYLTKRPRIGGPVEKIEREGRLALTAWPFRRVVTFKSWPAGEIALRIPLQVENGDRLVTAFAGSPERWTDYFFPPVDFRLAVAADGSETTLVEKSLAIGTDPADRAWFPVDVDLSPWAGRRIELVLAMATRWGTQPSFDLGAWEIPRVVNSADQAPDAG